MTASEDKFTRQILDSVHVWSSKLFSLRCSRDPAFRFRAGQFARLGVEKADGGVVWRPYSMVSAPHDEFLEFFSIVVPGGEFTSELSRLRAGDSLLVERQAYGFLTLDRFVGGRDLWLLASGTGLAPFLSILQDFEAWQRFDATEQTIDGGVGGQLDVALRCAGDVAVDRDVGDGRVIGSQPIAIGQVLFQLAEQGMRAADDFVGVEPGAKHGDQPGRCRSIGELAGGYRQPALNTCRTQGIFR